MDSVPPTPPPSTAAGPTIAITAAGAPAPTLGQAAVPAVYHTPTVSSQMALTPTHSHGSVKEPYQHKRIKVLPRASSPCCALHAARTEQWTVSAIHIILVLASDAARRPRVRLRSCAPAT